MEILRTLAWRKLRSTLTILGIVIGIFALTTMGGLAEHFNALIDGGVKYFGSTVQVGPPDGQAAILPLSKMDEIRQVDGVDAVFPSYGFAANPGAINTVNFNLPATIVSSDPAESKYDVLKVHTATGRSLTSDSRGDVVLGSGIANEFKKKVGETIDLPVKPQDAKPDFVNHTFTVVGVLAPTRTAPDSFAYVSIPAHRRPGQKGAAQPSPVVIPSAIWTSFSSGVCLKAAFLAQYRSGLVGIIIHSFRRPVFSIRTTSPSRSA